MRSATTRRTESERSSQK